MSRASILICLACAACHGDKPRVTPAPQPRVVQAPAPAAAILDPHVPLRVEALGSPVRSARTWTSALVPNARGSWNFITQTWELGGHENPEYVVVDLEAGTARVTNAPRHSYAVTKYQVRNQLRASNGRVFFPLSGAQLAYYDPADETVKDVPPVLPEGGPDKIIYSAKFGPDGILYGGTQSTALPTIVQIDPDTLDSRVIGHVGRDRKTYSYAYEIAVDPPWIYAAVGELPWELAALNIKTGESRILATRAEHGWMKVETRPEGVRAQLITNLHTPQQISEYVWCVDGKAIPAAGGKLPFKARNFPPRVKSLPGAPELDVTQINPDRDGVGRIRWRPAGSSDWKVVEFKVSQTKAIAIEALTALPDGSVLGGTVQYHGFFKTTGSASTLLGRPSPSQSKLAVLDGMVYTTGYPNAVLYAYDPARPWNGTTPEKAAAPGSNPRRLGNFTQSGAKYASFLVPAQNRVYFAGRLERSGFGAAVGYYEPASQSFAGHHDNLVDVVPAGLAVVPELSRVVLSERLRKDGQASQAELVVYDDKLAELERLVVKPGLTDTGLLFAGAAKGVLLGVITTVAPNVVYRYDLAGKRLLDWRELPEDVAAVAQRPGDGSLWIVEGTSLVRIDPATLEAVTFGEPGSMPAGIEHLVWQGDDLYASVDADLYRIARVGLP